MFYYAIHKLYGVEGGEVKPKDLGYLALSTLNSKIDDTIMYESAVGMGKKRMKRICKMVWLVQRVSATKFQTKRTMYASNMYQRVCVRVKFFE